MFKTSCFVVSRKSCIKIIFSYARLHEYGGVMVSIDAFQAGGQGSNPTRIFEFFFILNGHIFLQFLYFILKRYEHNLCQYVDIDSNHQNIYTKFINIHKTLVCARILSRLDYCNAVFTGMSTSNFNKLQTIQNAAAKMIFKKT